MENVKKLITEADGYQPHLIAPEQGYRRLIESTLITIKGPAEAAVDAVRIKVFIYVIFNISGYSSKNSSLDLGHHTCKAMQWQQTVRLMIMSLCSLINGLYS